MVRRWFIVGILVCVTLRSGDLGLLGSSLLLMCCLSLQLCHWLSVGLENISTEAQETSSLALGTQVSFQIY